MPASARAIANEFIRLAKETNRLLTPLQILKLCYIAHGWMLALYQRPLIADKIEAWKFGPVIPELYHSMKKYGSGYVTSPITNVFGLTNDGSLDSQQSDLLKQVFRIYGERTGIQLSQITHEPNTPWSITWDSEGQNSEISNDLIAEHYRRLMNERRSAQ